MIKFDLAKWRQNQIIETVKKADSKPSLLPQLYSLSLPLTLSLYYILGLLFLKIYSVIVRMNYFGVFPI